MSSSYLHHESDYNPRPNRERHAGGENERDLRARRGEGGRGGGNERERERNAGVGGRQSRGNDAQGHQFRDNVRDNDEQFRQGRPSRGHYGNYDDQSRQGRGNYDDQSRQRGNRDANAPVQCAKELGGCGGYHPGSATPAKFRWMHPDNSRNRLSECAHRCYLAGLPIIDASIQCPTGFHNTNPHIKYGDQLVYAILPRHVQLELAENESAMLNVRLLRQGGNTVLIRMADDSTSSKAKLDTTSPQLAAFPVPGDDIDAQIAHQKSVLKHFEKEQELKKLQDQIVLAKGGVPSSSQSSIAGKPPGQAGLDMLLSAGDKGGRHVPEQIGQWRRTTRAFKWTPALVKSVLGETVLARHGFWLIYSSVYAAEDVTQDVQAAFVLPDISEVVVALKSVRLAVQDLKDVHDAKLTGSMCAVDGH